MATSFSRPVRLLHIPKTAGTTLASGLLRVLGRKSRFVFSSDPAESRDRFLSIPEKNRVSINTFIGHSLYYTGIHEADSAAIVTYLREPVSRVKSFITHVAEGRSRHLAPDGKPPSEFDVDAFLASGNMEIENLQTKILINRDHLESSSGIDSLGDQAAFELAKKNLFDGVMAFGLQERFDESWVAIWTAIGHKPPLYATMNQKRGIKRIEFTKEQTERIRDLNRLDIQLHEAACTEFERRVASGAVPIDVLSEFRRLQAARGDRFTAIWNRARNYYYACRRTKRRIFGQ